MKQFLKDWMLVIAILAGIAGYFAYTSLPLPEEIRVDAHRVVSWLQPALIFAMLFLTFCRVKPRDLTICRWHWWLLAFQTVLFAAIGFLLVAMPHSGWRVLLEGAMICLICPTATAAAVVTGKLGGNVSHITAYTILVNLGAALLVPLMVPFVHPNPGMTMVRSGLLILSKVFPLLLGPLGAAWALRAVAPKWADALTRFPDLPFYIWAFSLALAIAVTTGSLVHSTLSPGTEAGLVLVSLACCAVQFWLGRKIGHIYGDKITAGQSLGQKNTVLAIWMGYTFFTPVTAIAGGFYSIWHNAVNSWQLYRHNHPGETKGENSTGNGTTDI